MTSATSEPPGALGEDPLLLDLGDLLVGIGRQLLSDAHEQPGVVPLTGTEMLVLRWVDRRPGCTPSEVADGMRLRRSNVSAALRGLTRKGMVLRRADPEDSRQMHLLLTDRARESSLAIRTYWARLLGERLPDLEPGDRAALERTVALLVRAEEPDRGR